MPMKSWSVTRDSYFMVSDTLFRIGQIVMYNAKNQVVSLLNVTHTCLVVSTIKGLISENKDISFVAKNHFRMEFCFPLTRLICSIILSCIFLEGALPIYKDTLLFMVQSGTTERDVQHVNHDKNTLSIYWLVDTDPYGLLQSLNNCRVIISHIYLKQL